MKAVLLCLVLLCGAQLSLASQSEDVSIDVEAPHFENARMLDYCSGVCIYSGDLRGQSKYSYSGYLYDSAEGWLDITVGTATKDIKTSISTSYNVNVDYYLKAQDGTLTQIIPGQYGTSNYARLVIPGSSDPDRKLLIKIKNSSNNYYYYYNSVNCILDVLSSEEVEVSKSSHWAVPVAIVLGVIVILFIASCVLLRIRNRRNAQKQRGRPASPPSPPNNIPTVYQQIALQSPHNPYEVPYHPHYAPVNPAYIMPVNTQPAAPVQVTVHAGQNDQPQALYPELAAPSYRVAQPNPYAHLPPINAKRY